MSALARRLMMAAGAAGASSDPYWDDVQLLIHNSAVDSSKNSIPLTSAGSLTTTTTNTKFGVRSLSFPTNTARVTASANFSLVQDLTFECWLYPTTFQWLCYLASLEGPGRSGFYMDNSTLCQETYGVGSTSLGVMLTANTWQHIAITYTHATGMLKAYKNGVGTTPVAKNGSGLTGFILGGGGGNNSFTGQLEEFRITSAVRYTTNFTPPTEPFPNG